MIATPDKTPVRGLYTHQGRLYLLGLPFIRVFYKLSPEGVEFTVGYPVFLYFWQRLIRQSG